MKKEIKNIDLENIKDPSFLKELSYKELDVLSNDISSYLIDIISKNGGHLSSNLGVVDASIALCRVFDFSKDKIIFDVGHQSYTYKLLTGRDLKTIRKKDGISGFQKMNESIYDHYEAGHSSTSISAALAMATARDYKKEKNEVIAFIGDSSITNGLALEAINNASNQDHKFIIVLNDNDMSISKSVGGVARSLRKISISNFYRKSRKAFKKLSTLNRLGYFIYRSLRRFKNILVKTLTGSTFLDNIGFNIVGPINGHDIKAMEKCFIQAKKNDKSTIIIINTIKGKGYPFAEDDTTGKWHGVSAFNKSTGDLYASNDTTWSQYFASLINKRMSKDPNVFTIVPGTGYGSEVTRLFKDYPGRMIDVGIAEEHAFVYASGLSLSGIHPNICIYSTFLQRAYDELSHDLARMNLDSTILIDRAGLVGNDGETHQGLYDEAFLYSIPNVTLAMASSTYEASKLYDLSYEHHGVFAIRFPKEVVHMNTKKYDISYGKWHVVKEGNDTCIISLGPVINELRNLLEDSNSPYGLVNALFIKPLDLEIIKDIASKYNRVIVYDPYSTVNGLPTFVAKELALINYKGKVILKAVDDTFVKQGSIKEQREEYHLLPSEIVKL